MDFPALKEAEGTLELKRKQLHEIFTEAGPDLDMDNIKSISGDSVAKVAEIRARNEEIDALAVRIEGLKAVAQAARGSREHADRREAGDEQTETKGRGDERGAKSVGELFTASIAFKGRARGGVGPEAHLDVEVKTLFQTTAGWAPETTRTGRVVEYATRPIQVIDLIPSNTTSQAAVLYMEETTFANNAAETAEGSPYAESALALTERESAVRKIGTWLPVTDEQLEDEAQVRGYINNRLPFMLNQRLDYQILQGSGTAPNLRGLLNTSGIQTQPKGGDTVPDAIYKALTKIRVTGRSNPNAVICHPTDWQGVRLLRTTDGIYIWGSPSEAGEARIWGLPVAQTDAITLGTALPGDFANHTELVTRRGVEVQISNAHADFFVNGKQAIRADLRAALVVYRPAALCTVTGL